MQIFNDNLNINIVKNKIYINGVQLNTTPQMTVEKFRQISKDINYLNIDIIKHALSKTEIEVLLGLSYNVKYFHQQKTNERYELTFSYHFPLCYETHFIDIMVNKIDLVYKGHLLNFATCGEFIKADLSNKLEQNTFNKKYAYLIRHNDKKISLNHNKKYLKSILNNWNNYCTKKFNKTFTPNEIAAYNYFYNLDNFYALHYEIGNDIMAEGVVYYSNETNTLYYCIFWWNDKYKSLSPGIYNYSKIISYCIDKKLFFSFCYGVQGYKLNILKHFKYTNNKETWSQLIYGDCNE